MSSSHRNLVHRHAQSILSGKTRPLAPGETCLYSYYEPSLTSGLHHVKVSQTIEAPADPRDSDQNTQKDAIEAIEQAFIATAPRFSLQPGAVDSVFPKPGTQAEHTVLPHIVLTDPHLPWSRSPSAAHLPPDEDEKTDRSRTTWLALMVFSIEELQMGQADIDDIMRYVPNDSGAKREQSETGALRMMARDTPKLNGAITTTAFNKIVDAKDAAEPTDVVVMPGQLFTALFTEPGGDGSRLNVASYKHMAHVRHIGTDGMANAGSKDDDALFSIVISRRTGLIDSDLPTPLVVHLLSLVFDEKMPVPTVNDRVAMTSLHSWTYTCLPSQNIAGKFELLTNLGQDLNVLRTGDNAQPEPFVSGDASQDLSIVDLIEARKADGYTLSPTRTVTGEVTAALLRGPLVPRRVKRPLRDGFTMQSNHGSDLAIFDNKLGLLDITYSSAWQLGKKLAMADEPFCAALARLRSAVHSRGLDGSKQEIHALFGDDGHERRTKTADSMIDLVQGLVDINASLHASGGAATSLARTRWRHQDEEEISLKSIDKLSQNSHHISARMSSQSDAAALMLAMSDKRGVMHEYNIAASPDYAYIYSWILNKVHLANVPANYLIPDPLSLPQETLRFFFIDDNWIDALIDGALSLANHWGYTPDMDKSRIAIKLAINERLRTPDESLGGWHALMPRYGFLLRSQLLVQFPDIVVEAVFSETRSGPISKTGGNSGSQTPANTPPKQPILVQKGLAPDTMYCLFDAAPPDLRRIILRMPPHQQCFKIGQKLTNEKLAVTWKKLYTTTEGPSTAQPGDTLGSTDFEPTGKPAPVFDWSLRTLDPESFATFLVNRQREGREKEFSDEEPTSAVLGLQLNNPILELDIGDVFVKQQ